MKKKREQEIQIVVCLLRLVALTDPVAVVVASATVCAAMASSARVRAFQIGAQAAVNVLLATVRAATAIDDPTQFAVVIAESSAGVDFCGVVAADTVVVAEIHRVQVGRG